VVVEAWKVEVEVVEIVGIVGWRLGIVLVAIDLRLGMALNMDKDRNRNRVVVVVVVENVVEDSRPWNMGKLKECSRLVV